MLMRKIYNQTLEIKNLINDYDTEQREVWIENLQRLLDTRERTLKQLSGSCTDEERPIAKEIMAMNRWIDDSLQSIKNDIIQDMKRFKHRKRTVSRYRRPYDGPTKDGMFLDKRK
ncbi:hypothetical protein EWI07_01065 [Sporolactobacillus sp. THM7-4]|nr:hypothetical protein EWI07_01065 [Sporolactobacillus sp. THM7-4]